MTQVFKPCPFCGRQPKMSEHSSCDDLYVHLVCSCEVGPRSHGVAAEFAWERGRGRYRCRTREEAYDYASKRAIERWNTRHEPPSLVECDACPRSSGCVETCMKTKEQP